VLANSTSTCCWSCSELCTVAACGPPDLHWIMRPLICTKLCYWSLHWIMIFFAPNCDQYHSFTNMNFCFKKSWKSTYVRIQWNYTSMQDAWLAYCLSYCFWNLNLDVCFCSLNAEELQVRTDRLDESSLSSIREELLAFLLAQVINKKGEFHCTNSSWTKHARALRSDFVNLSVTLKSESISHMWH